METTSNVGDEATVKNETPTFDEIHSQATAENTEVKESDLEELNEQERQIGEQLSKIDEEIIPEAGENLTEVLETNETLAAYQPSVENIPRVEPELSPDEKIIDGWLKNGKTEVSMNELIQAGFEAEELDPHTNIIGIFKLSRILLVSPYKIEKNS